MEGGTFGNDNFSVEAAQNMFGKTEAAIEDIIDKTTIEQVSSNVWVVHLPIVNCSIIETSAGLVIIDTGMKPAGPALLKSIESVSDKKIHTIIYTHGHVDHAYGTWALMQESRKPYIIAHKNLLRRFDRYIRLNGSLAKYMSQPKNQMPVDSSDLVWPTITFDDEYELKVGDLVLHLKHFEGETDDQFLIWEPGQKMLFGTDYYQGFLPNAGNGKRIQRNITEWIDALKYMHELNAEILIPSHGEVIRGNEEVKSALSIHHEAMTYIYLYTIKALNDGKRKDQIVQAFNMPEKYSHHPLLKEQYVTAKDICKMVIRQYTGWWDDIPSHWSPASLFDQANSIIDLAGGLDKLLAHINALKDEDIVMASHFLDWAYIAAPDDTRVLELVLEVYKMRIEDKQSKTQEMLVYLDHMAEIRAKMK